MWKIQIFSYEILIIQNLIEIRSSYAYKTDSRNCKKNADESFAQPDPTATLSYNF